MKTIDNSQDVLDTRDVIARRDELQEEREELSSARIEASGDPDLRDNDPETHASAHKTLHDAGKALTEWDEENAEELKALNDFIEEFEGYADSHGEALIRDSYFEDYAQELAADITDMRDVRWPYTCIDWERAARELQYDYSSADFSGVTYWFRS